VVGRKEKEGLPLLCVEGCPVFLCKERGKRREGERGATMLNGTNEDEQGFRKRGEPKLCDRCIEEEQIAR